MLRPNLVPSSLRSLASASGRRAFAAPTSTPRPSASSPGAAFIVFDRQAKLEQRNRAASDPERSRLTDYVKDQVAGNMVDRLLVSTAPWKWEGRRWEGRGEGSGGGQKRPGRIQQRLRHERRTEADCSLVELQDIKRRFPALVDVGAGPGFIAKHLDPEITQKLTMTDSSGNAMLQSVSAAIRARLTCSGATSPADPTRSLISQRRCCTATSTSRQMVRSFPSEACRYFLETLTPISASHSRD